MKKIFTLAGISLGVGLALLLLVYLITGGRFYTKTDKTKFKHDEFASSAVKQLDLDTDSVNVQVIGTQSDKVTVDYSETGDSKYEITAENGLLKIHQDLGRIDISISFVDFNGLFEELSGRNRKKDQLVVKLPQDILEQLTLQADSGNVELQDLAVKKSAELSVDSGNIDLKNLSIQGNTQIEADSGDTTAEQFSVAGQLDSKVDSGSLKLSDSRVRDLTALVDSGDITLDNTNIAKELTAEVLSGNISLDRLDAGKKLTFKADSGDISGTLLGRLEDYSITSKVEDGENSLPNRTTAGSKTLEVIADSGNINLEFTE